MRIGLVVGVLLLAVGEGLDGLSPVAGPAAQVSAVVVLAWVAWTQRQEMKELRERHSEAIDKLCQRWDAWEKLRHEDSRKLQEVLRDLMKHCSRASSGG